jgi:hypothetical protein
VCRGQEVDAGGVDDPPQVQARQVLFDELSSEFAFHERVALAG